ncbi:MAG TPA: D-alanyl-D-alanine carboxypeptidase family protein [Nitrospiraceae bacterium]|nr:D-alanyl-D-alanine carboxypeptidase family protein [Nitrospiraceae bacterium]
MNFPRTLTLREALLVPGILGWGLLSLITPATVLASHTSPPTAVVPNASSSGEFPSLSFFRRHQAQAQSILLKDLSTGRTLYEVRANRRVAPASLTKIMSALVILEYGQLHDPVTVSRKAASARKIHLRLHAGHVFRLEDLLKAMLITSANDACLAAVEHVGGSEEMFVAMMNNKAHRLGLLDTHFSNACGFDSPTHYTTAADLATLSEAAMQDRTFRTLVRKEVDMIFPLNANRSYWLRNTNRLLGRIPGIEGIKTGFTSQAGRCLVAKASQDGKEVLLVLLHANRRWDTASTLLRQGMQSLQ